MSSVSVKGSTAGMPGSGRPARAASAGVSQLCGVAEGSDSDDVTPDESSDWSPRRERVRRGEGSGDEEEAEGEEEGDSDIPQQQNQPIQQRSPQPSLQPAPKKHSAPSEPQPRRRRGRPSKAEVAARQAAAAAAAAAAAGAAEAVGQDAPGDVHFVPETQLPEVKARRATLLARTEELEDPTDIM